MPISIENDVLRFNDNSTQITAANPSVYVGMRSQVFTSSGTFTIPAGINAIKVSLQGGGGGGGGAAYSTNYGTFGNGGAGGNGGYAEGYLTGLTPGNTLTITIGAGGAGGAANVGVTSYFNGRLGSNGTTGGTSTISSGTQTITAQGATGGSFGSGGQSGGGPNFCCAPFVPLPSNGSAGVTGTNSGASRDKSGSRYIASGASGAGGVTSSAGSAGGAGIIVIEY